MISSRPRYISAVSTAVERSLNGAKEPIGPAKPEPGPTPPSVVAAAANAPKVVSEHAAQRGVEQDHERAGDQDADVEEDEDDDRAQRALVDDRAVDAQRRDAVRVQGLVELASQHLGDHDVAHELDRAAGRAGRGAEQDQAEEDQGGERGPLVEVGAREPGRGHHRHDVEDGVAYRGLAGEDVLGGQLHDDEGRRGREHGEVDAELLVAGERPSALRRAIAANISAKFVPAMTMKTVIVHCVTGANGSIERASVEKPAVAMVANACPTARNRSMRGSSPVQPSAASARMASALIAT